ncbi:MAG: hypothetical protein B7Y40_07120 [Gammaproteobacteria bacterium 28-57-27]|nr:MAG: hypothetical protein B7Y40_07120 [Gammaproteobacteria bacterium 28-57-27]
MLHPHSTIILAPILTPLVLILSLHSGTVLAVDDAPPPATAGASTAQEPAPLAAPQTDIPEPEVNIREEPTQTIEEFRSQGRPYMIRVTPRGGLPPYYMVDNDGDGTLETRVNSPSNPPATPRWVLFRW